MFILLKKYTIKNILNKINENKILAEEYISGSDYTVALMNGKCLGILEIITNESPFIIFLQNIKAKKLFIDIPKKLHQKL